MYNKILIENCLKNETIYLYLKRNGFSENYVKNLRKKEGYILLNKSVAYTNALIKNGDLLELFKNPNVNKINLNLIQNQIPITIIYEDDDILVVNKPSGMPTIPSRKHFEYNLASAVANYMRKKDSNFVVRIINRLDKDTSGLVCIAKHSLISNLLNSNDYIRKTYFAICSGKVKPVTINKNIATITNELGINYQKRIISKNGKPAITYVKPIAFDGTNTLCEITLKYGRTHQIRVHLASINHSLLGDCIYGVASDKICHTALACSKMIIYNPINNKEINLKIDLPDDMIQAFHTSFVL